MIKNKELAFELFLKDMNQPAIQMAIYSSFKRYATLRDQLIAEYVKVTGIPADEFHSQIALKMVDELVK
jgi:hypothetical protein